MLFKKFSVKSANQKLEILVDCLGHATRSILRPYANYPLILLQARLLHRKLALSNFQHQTRSAKEFKAAQPPLSHENLHPLYEMRIFNEVMSHTHFGTVEIGRLAVAQHDVQVVLLVVVLDSDQMQIPEQIPVSLKPLLTHCPRRKGLHLHFVQILLLWEKSQGVEISVPLKFCLPQPVRQNPLVESFVQNLHLNPLEGLEIVKNYHYELSQSQVGEQAGTTF